MGDLELTPEEVAMLDATENEDTHTSQSPLAQRFIEATEKATGFKPHQWQLDVACSIHEGKRDVLVLAGTGYGKTLPFVMNCFLRPEMVVWIVSPLNYIEIEQAKVFRGWGLRAIAVNSMTSQPNLVRVSGYAPQLLAILRITHRISHGGTSKLLFRRSSL
jgi:superfamily II DNA helicase RecQ